MSASRCLLSQADIRALDMKYFSHMEVYNEMTLPQRITKAPDLFGPTPRPWQPHRKRLYNVPSRSRWVVFIAFYISLLGATITILYFALSHLRAVGLPDIWTQGIGAINPNSIFDILSTSTSSESLAPSEQPSRIQPPASNSQSILTSAVITNLPQLLFSFFYYIYNGIFTCMMSGYEWGRFANKDQPRTLRVSQPQGQQRSTYWLSLPWKFSLPLICVSALMHWLVSRSLFLVHIDVYNYAGQWEEGRSISNCGFSALAMVLVLMLIFVMLLAMVLISVKRIPANIPVVGTCSWAISGACHDIGGEEDVALKPLIWGVTEKSMGGGSDGYEKPGHCSITSREVDGPLVECVYA